MIDCRECRKLIDRDLVEPLDQPKRMALTNHLRSCQNCVTYRKERLKDSSILRRSVDELKERAEEPAAAPPPPPRPTFWPWIVTAAVLVILGFGTITLMQSGAGDADSDDSVPKPRPPKSTAATPPKPTGPAGKSRPPEARPPVKSDLPTTPRTARIRVHGIVRDSGGEPTSDAEVALIASESPDAECPVTRTGRDGTFDFDIHGPFPVHLTAWKDASVSRPTLVQKEGSVTLVLEAGNRIVGDLRTDGDLDLSSARVMALWDGAGRSVSTPATGGRFSLSLPSDRPVELRPYRTGLKTYAFMPPVPLTLAAGYAGPVSIRGAKAKLMLINLTHGAQPVRTAPMLVTAIPADGPPRNFTPLPGSPGTYHAALTHGVYRLVVWVRGFAEADPEYSIEDRVFAPVPLEASAFSFSGTLQMDPPDATLPEEIVVRRSPRLFEGEPGIRVSILGSGGRGTFNLDGIPWSTVIVDAGSGLKQRFGPFALPRKDLTITLPVGASVHGTVKTAGGLAVPGLLVAAESSAGTTFVPTRKDGSYRFQDLPAGELFVYPLTAVARFESFAGLKDEYRVRLSPGAAIPRPLVLSGGPPSSVVLTDESARPVVGMIFIKTLKGALVSALYSPPLDPTQPTEDRTLELPPISHGGYLAEASESGVIYPNGRVNLPGRLDVVVHRERPRLTVKVSAPAGSPIPDTPLRLSILTRRGNTVGRLELPHLQSTDIGGLEPGPYRIEVEWGSHRACGLVQVGTPGSPNVVLALTLR